MVGGGGFAWKLEGQITILSAGEHFLLTSTGSLKRLLYHSLHHLAMYRSHDYAIDSNFGCAY